MKQHSVFPLLAAAGGAAAFGLRLWQNHSAFEVDTGLPIPGAPAAAVLAGFLLLMLACLFFLVRKLPKESGAHSAFPASFSCADHRLLMLPVLGVLLIGAAGLADLYEGFGLGNLLEQMRASADPYAFPETEPITFPPRIQQLLGVLELLSTAALLPAVSACRYRDGRGDTSPASGFPGKLLLVPPVALVIRLVLTYRMDSVNPALGTYYVELMALVFLTLGFYRLSSFAFQAGRTRLFALYVCAAVVLCFCSLADGGPHLSSLLLYAGGGTALLGFLLLRLPHVGAAVGDVTENTVDTEGPA